jgi:putative spermidine/putrescine transport system substrate-binding protein
VQRARRNLIGSAAGLAAASLFARVPDGGRRTITLCAFGGVFEEAYRESVVEPFMRAHPDISVRYYGVPHSAQMLGALRAQRSAPQIDVCLIDIQSAGIATDEGLLTPLDVRSVPQIAQLEHRASVPGVAGPAAMFDHLVLLYSPAVFPIPPDSWSVLWDASHAGQIAIQRPPNVVGVAFTLIANFMAGVEDYAGSYERGIASVARMAPNVLNWDPKPDPYSFIVNGSATLGVGWNARAQLYASRSPDRIAVALPREGTVPYMNVITQVRNSPRPVAARRFIEYALGRRAQSAFAERMFYAPAHAAAEVGARAAGRMATAEQLAGMLPVDWLKVARIRDPLSREWRRRILLRR